MTVSGLARLLVGGDVTQANGQLQSRRRQIQKWLTEQKSTSKVGWMSEKNARQVAEALGTDPSRYMRPRPTQADRLRREIELRQEKLRRIDESLPVPEEAP